MKVMAISCAGALWLSVAAAANAVAATAPEQPAQPPPLHTAPQGSGLRVQAPLHATDPAPEPVQRAERTASESAASTSGTHAEDEQRRAPRTGLLLLAGLAALLFMAARHSS